MTDYTEQIKKNFAPYPGLVQPDVVAAMNAMLNELSMAGFGTLVDLLLTRREEQALDILFEAWVCQMLRRNPNITDLEYEPDDAANPPDFRFQLEGVRFDVQVKRLYKVGNAPDKEAFQQRFEERAHQIAVPWFLNLWLSDDFQRKDIDGLFYYIKKNLHTFKTMGWEQALDNFPYGWPAEGEPLARFSFHPANDPSKMSHMRIGVFQNAGSWQDDGDGGTLLIAAVTDVAALRRGFEGQLDKARKSLPLDTGSHQANIVIIQPESNLICTPDTVADVFYGDEQILVETGTVEGRPRNHWVTRQNNGLLHPGQYRKICGVIVVPGSVWFLDETFRGTYYPHPSHLSIVAQHPNPFPGEMLFHVEARWRQEGDTPEPSGASA